MLKRYKVNDAWFWFEEGEQPEGAIEEKAVKPENKERKPTNKARTPRTKKAVD
jgi:hypothetical protein